MNQDKSNKRHELDHQEKHNKSRRVSILDEGQDVWNDEDTNVPSSFVTDQGLHIIVSRHLFEG